jgi:hypothetical protein
MIMVIYCVCITKMIVRFYLSPSLMTFIFLTRILFPEREEVRVVPINSSRVSREEVPSSGWRFHLHLEEGRDFFL